VSANDEVTARLNRLRKSLMRETQGGGGGGFNPRIKPIKSTSALAAERRLSPISPEISSFPAAC